MVSDLVIVKIKDMTLAGHFLNDSTFQNLEGIVFNLTPNEFEVEFLGRIATEHIVKISQSLDRLTNYWTQEVTNIEARKKALSLGISKGLIDPVVLIIGLEDAIIGLTNNNKEFVRCYGEMFKKISLLEECLKKYAEYDNYPVDSCIRFYDEKRDDYTEDCGDYARKTLEKVKLIGEEK